MKTTQYILLLFLVASACSKSKDLPDPSPDLLKVNRSSLTLNGLSNAIDSFYITYAGNWTITTSPTDTAWLHISETSGSGNKRITVAVTGINEGTASRSVEIVVSGQSNTAPVRLTCTQQPLPVSPVYPHVFGGSDGDQFNAAIATSDGGIIAVGFSTSANDDVLVNRGERDLWILKTDKEGNKMWSRTFGGTLNDEGDAIVVTSDGGYMISGYTESNDGDVTGNHGSWDAWVIKIDADGNKIWQKTFGGSKLERAFGLTALSDGNFMIAVDATSTDGDVVDNHSDAADVWLVKLNNSGDKLWSKCFGGSSGEQMPFSMTRGNDGGVVVTGFNSAFIADGDVLPSEKGMDIWVLKVSDNGNLEWQKTFGKNNDDIGWKIIATTDGNYVVTGTTYKGLPPVNGVSKLQNNIWVLKIDNAGNLLWDKELGGDGLGTGRGAVALASGAVMILGNTSSPDELLENDAWIVTLNSNGEIVNQQAFGGSKDDQAFAIIAGSDDKYFVLGTTNSTDGDLSGSHGGADGWLFSVN